MPNKTTTKAVKSVISQERLDKLVVEIPLLEGKKAQLDNELTSIRKEKNEFTAELDKKIADLKVEIADKEKVSLKLTADKAALKDVGAKLSKEQGKLSQLNSDVKELDIELKTKAVSLDKREAELVVKEDKLKADLEINSQSVISINKTKKSLMKLVKKAKEWSLDELAKELWL